MGQTHRTALSPHPQWRLLVVKVMGSVLANNPTILPAKGTKYSACDKRLFSRDYGGEIFANYVYAYQGSTDEDGGVLLYFAPSPEQVPVYLDGFTSTQVGKFRWPELTQTFLLPRDEFTDLAPLLEPPPELGQQWTRLYGEQVETDQPYRVTFVEFRVTWQDHNDPIIDYDSDAQTGIVTPKTTTMVPASSAPAGGNVKQTTVGNGWALRETRAPDSDDMENYSRGFPDFQSLALPAVLKGVNVRWSESEGEGESVSGGGVVVVGFPYDANLSGNNSATSSSSLSPTLSFDRVEGRNRTIPAMRYFFYLPKTLTISNVLSKLGTIVGATVNVWPDFQEEGHAIAVLGVRASVRASAARSGSVYCKDEDMSRYGQTSNQATGEDYDISTSAGTINIPAAIHGIISFGGDTTKTVSVAASAESEINASGYPITIPGGVTSKTVTQSLTASVSPSSIPATSPSAIPTSGYWVHPRSIQAEVQDDQWTRVSAVVFNAASI